MVRRRRACGGSSTGRCSCASCVFNLPPPPCPLAALPQPTLADASLGNANFTRKPVWAATIFASFACRDLDNRLGSEHSSLYLIIWYLYYEPNCLVAILYSEHVLRLSYVPVCSIKVITNICSCHLCSGSIRRHIPWMINILRNPLFANAVTDNGRRRGRGEAYIPLFMTCTGAQAVAGGLRPWTFVPLLTAYPCSTRLLPQTIYHRHRRHFVLTRFYYLLL